MTMNREYMAARLPEAPPEGLVEWVEQTQRDEFGLPLCSWQSEWVRLAPQIEEIMCNQGTQGRSIWVADCWCGACGESYYTAKVPGEDAIMLTVGEDGGYYTAELDGGWNPETTEIQRNGDEFYCPFCGSKVELIHRRRLKGGRMQRLMVMTLQAVDGYLGIFYWITWRKIEEWGAEEYGASPYSAYLLNENGTLVKFRHAKRDMNGHLHHSREWKPIRDNDDDGDDIYQDWGSICNRKRGYALWPQAPKLDGTTGEKTGLEEYLAAGGYRCVQYLKLWRTVRGVENLCKTGQAALVKEIVNLAYCYSYTPSLEAAKYLDIKKRKPHEMLGVSRADYRVLRENDMPLTIQHIETWNRYRKCGGSLGFLDLIYASARFGAGLGSALELMKDHPGEDLPRLERYMEKQGLSARDIGLLTDTRRMLRNLYGGRALSAEELWPRQLQAAHDNAAAMLATRNQREKAEKFAAGFARILDNFGQLQWNDGELCIVLPQSNDDLIREGKVLRHCVGTYGNGHIDGTSVIFFVRHYRRPERPYYTLDINMQKRGKEVQLHGYGNERHGPNKEYTHKIPVKVRAFCDRWENEILRPFCEAQAKQEQEAKTA